MELRKLQSTDLFSMVRILNVIGFKNIKESIDFKKISEARKKIAEARKNGNEETAENIESDLGNEIIFSVVEILLDKLPKIETDLYKFLGSLANMKDKDVAKMEIGEFMDLLVAVIKKEEFVDFFNRASKLIK